MGAAGGGAGRAAQLNNACEVCPDSSALQGVYMAVLVMLLVLAMVYAITQGMRWFKCGAIAMITNCKIPCVLAVHCSQS